MTSVNKSNAFRIDLNIGDQLTSISCGHVVVELVKFFLYQRQQIPYTYPWLKQAVNTKKLNEDDRAVRESFQSERHFRIASSALENLDFILKSLLQEINCSSLPQEVCITLGGSSVTCKEVYRLLLPTACHKPQCHSTLIANDQKIQGKVFRSLVTAEKLSQVLFNQLPPTNMFVFLKKKAVGGQDTVISCESFQQTSGFRIPWSAKVVVIDFRTKDLSNVACCNEIQIFGDVTSPVLTETNSDEDLNMIESTDTATWYQSSYIVRGFKDSVINGSSVANSWLSS